MMTTRSPLYLLDSWRWRIGIAILAFVRWAPRKSVFRRQPRELSMNDMVAIYFHRLAATTYFAYAVWGGISTIKGVPSLVASQGQDWTTIFSFCVLITTAPACFGATFWPAFARMEALFGSSVVALFILYLIIYSIQMVQGSVGISYTPLLASLLILPICRTIIVIAFLMRQADQRQELIKARLEKVIKEDGDVSGLGV